MPATVTELTPTTGVEITGLSGSRLVDLVVWDNTIMLHRAMPYGESSSRLMHRTSLAGEEAVA